jgi:hypothetical protein
MTDQPQYPVEGLDPYQALVALHHFAGDLDVREIPGFEIPTLDVALRSVAQAPEGEIPISARLAVLYSLARRGMPGYADHGEAYGLLVASVAERRGLMGDRLLEEIRDAAGAGVPLHTIDSAPKLLHHETAFIGEDVCTTRTVRVGGLRATWIFSEFETDATFQHLADWVNPANWPRWGRLLFKQMQPVGSTPVHLGPPGAPHWHGVFDEEVQLVRRVKTRLHCDYWVDRDQAVGMTYDLDRSLDGQINVDRGFILVNKSGSNYRVKALKIVGFTEDMWDRVALFACPFWTDWARFAAEGATTTTPVEPTHTPTSGGPFSMFHDNVDDWMTFFGNSAHEYVDLFDGMNARKGSASYSTSDCFVDTTRYWSKLAKDWANAWSYGLEALYEVAQEGLDAGLTPPGASPERGRGLAAAVTSPTLTQTEATTTALPGLDPANPPVSSDLVSIREGAAVIPSTDISVTVVGAAGGYAVRLGTTNTTVGPGLYVGELRSAAGHPVGPVQLYISRARVT